MSTIRHEIEKLNVESRRLSAEANRLRKADVTHRAVAGTRARRAAAEAEVRKAKRKLERAKIAEAHALLPGRYEDWRKTVERSEGASLSGERLSFHRIGHRGSFGRFLRAIATAEYEGGRVTGATFYRTWNDMLEAKRAGDKYDRESSIWQGR